MPCGCYAWKLGGEVGWKTCSWHATLHLRDLNEAIDGFEDNFVCDCVGCRAEEANLSAYQFVTELWEKERIGRRAKTPTDKSADGLPIIEQEDCGCLWHRSGNTWVLSACETHYSNRANIQVHRNATRKQGE